jgi:gliding motility-associated-like protein
LSTKSPNGISGTWNPASISTAASADYIFTPDPGQCASQAVLAVNLFSYSYSITQECINNKYLIKVVPNTNYPLSDYTYTWFNSKGAEIAYNTSAFDFTEYIKNLNTQPLESLEFKIRAANGSCEIEKTFGITNNLCGIQDTVSPNDDGINDNLDLSTLNITSITIFNRYGREVYNFKGKYNNQWYGQCKEGRLPAGTYFYIISTENEESRPGWVFLFY